MQKYVMTTSTKVVCGVTLTQIQRVSDGVFGGWIEKESNLSQDGTCFVYGDAVVYGSAWVSGNARAYGNAQVYGNAAVYGDAEVFGNARAYGNARVFGNAWVYGGALVYDNAWVYGNARVFGNAVVYDNAGAYDNAQVSGDAVVYGDAQVYGNAQVYGDAWVSICLFVQQLRYNITVVDTHIFIGCQGHTWKYWKENIQAIGKEAGYSELEIKDVDKLLRVLTRQVGAEILKRR